MLSGIGSGDYDELVDERNVKNIFKPSDEFDFWIKVQSTATSNQMQKKAKLFNDQFALIDS